MEKGSSVENQQREAHEFASVLSELEYRGFIQQCTDLPGLEKELGKGQLTFYLGIDPTGESLHIGHMVPVFALAHLARAGHKAIALVGGATAMIGDPSGKTEMRKMLSEEQISENAGKVAEQVRSFLRGLGIPEENFEVVDNRDWLLPLKYIDFLREIGRHFSVNRMLSFETYKQRLETGLSFIEFNYQLLQSYDYLVLNRDKGAKLQIGGDDQWGNIVAGIDLIRRCGQGESYGLTFPLITRSDGKKMGKSEKGAIFLNPDLCPPFELYQYWRNIPDADLGKMLRLFTFLPREEIEGLVQLKDQDINRAKEVLAYEYTKLIHGSAQADAALQAARSMFSSAATNKSAIPGMEISLLELEDGIGVLELFVRAGLCSSKGEARRLVQQQGARVNDELVSDPELRLGSEQIRDSEIMLRAGKKRFFRVLVKDAE